MNGKSSVISGKRTTGQDVDGAIGGSTCQGAEVRPQMAAPSRALRSCRRRIVGKVPTNQLAGNASL